MKIKIKPGMGSPITGLNINIDGKHDYHVNLLGKMPDGTPDLVKLVTKKYMSDGASGTVTYTVKLVDETL